MSVAALSELPTPQLLADSWVRVGEPVSRELDFSRKLAVTCASSYCDTDQRELAKAVRAALLRAVHRDDAGRVSDSQRHALTGHLRAWEPRSSLAPDVVLARSPRTEDRTSLDVVDLIIETKGVRAGGGMSPINWSLASTVDRRSHAWSITGRWLAESVKQRDVSFDGHHDIEACACIGHSRRRCDPAPGMAAAAMQCDVYAASLCWLQEGTTASPEILRVALLPRVSHRDHFRASALAPDEWVVAGVDEFLCELESVETGGWTDWQQQVLRDFIETSSDYYGV